MSSRSNLFSDSLAGPFNNFIRAAGGWGNVGGPGYLMARIFLSGAVSSVILGLAGSAVGAAVVGTGGFPFLVMSCFGFAFGAFSFYRNAIRQSMIALDRHPRLMQLHLDANYPSRRFYRYRPEQMTGAVFSRSYVLQSMLVGSWLMAQPALDQIVEIQEQAILDDARVQAAGGASALDEGIAEE